MYDYARTLARLLARSLNGCTMSSYIVHIQIDISYIHIYHRLSPAHTIEIQTVQIKLYRTMKIVCESSLTLGTRAAAVADKETDFPSYHSTIQYALYIHISTEM